MAKLDVHEVKDQEVNGSNSVGVNFLCTHTEKLI